MEDKNEAHICTWKHLINKINPIEIEMELKPIVYLFFVEKNNLLLCSFNLYLIFEKDNKCEND